MGLQYNTRSGISLACHRCSPEERFLQDNWEEENTRGRFRLGSRIRRSL